MKAAVCERYGPPGNVVELREVDKPEPTGDQILLRVHAASVNRADLDGLGPRPQMIRLFVGLRAPRNQRMGIDVAGVVEATGPNAVGFKAGARAYGDLFAFGAGAFAEYACVPEKALRLIPDTMTFEDAATLPHSSVLAVQGLRRRDGTTPKAGDKVLIDGASGNVGPFAVQLAKALGAEVTGVCSPGKMDFVRSLGADNVIDYTTTDYTKERERYDWIVDTDSHHGILAVRRALAPNGVYVTLGGTTWPIVRSLIAGPLISRFSDRWSGLLLWWKPFNLVDIAHIEELIAAGLVKPRIDRTYPLEQAVDALRQVDEGRANGKVVITMQDPLRPRPPIRAEVPSSA
ncbi:MAG: NAD(P)-dependent alcohol dehydrogenase [Candidatus Limnocylindrales bacterium]